MAAELVAATSSPAVAAASAIPAAAAAIAARTTATVGRTSGTVAGKPGAAARPRIAVTAPVTSTRCARALAAALEITDPAVADSEDDRCYDQSVHDWAAHHGLPWRTLLVHTNWSQLAKLPFIDRSNEVWNLPPQSSPCVER